ncbi:MAG: hypothetical protein PGN23_14100 [Sphingomonas adhaesiva]|uniref:hypothetical protein n=1 Tax=Sphingomonas adhaesiva TaxID=28212 RepID=UPI002FFB41E9
MKVLGGLVAVAAALASAPALAQAADDAGTVFSAALTGGTLGVGPEVGARFSDHLGVRGSASFLKISADFDPDDITYKGRLNLESYGLMADVYPFGGHFRVSAGARINKNRARVEATPTSGSVDVGGESYDFRDVGTLSGRADVKNLTPALTLGWSGTRRRGFMYSFDAGVLFQGSVRLREFTASGEARNDPDFRASLETERRRLQDDIDDYKVYPILQMSIGYRF